MNHRHISTCFAILSALWFAYGCSSMQIDSTIAEGGIRLSAPEINQAVAGNTLHLSEYGNSAAAKFSKTGRLMARNSQGETSKGNWYINGNDHLCIKYKKWGYGDTICYSIYKVKNEYRQFTSGGILAGSFTISSETSNPTDVGVNIPPEEMESPVETTAPASSTMADKATSLPASATLTVAGQGAAIQESNTKSLSTAEKARQCPGCVFKNADLAGANLVKAQLPGADLAAANLAGANLKMANLKGATLTGANLTNANLAGADLAGANLAGANLTGAEFYGTILKGTNLDKAIGGDFMGAVR